MKPRAVPPPAVKEDADRLIAEGWQLHGGPFIVRHTDDRGDVMHALLIKPARGEDGERFK